MKITIGILGVLAVLVLIFLNRWWVITHAMSLSDPPELLEAHEEPGAQWFNDYYSVFEIDEKTFALAETRYWQLNFNYLILGEERAVLLDCGPGIHDIRPLVRSITKLPVTFIPSHLHYDHVCSDVEFVETALIDLPYLRNRAPGNKLTLEKDEHLGIAEGFDAPTLSITEWLEPDSSISLGGRELRVIHTPGHTLNSVTLVDESAGYAFTGDFFLPGTLLEMVPYGGMGDYVLGVEALLAHTTPSTRYFGAHRNVFAEPRQTGLPELSYSDLRDTYNTLVQIREGKATGQGIFPVVYTINNSVELWANPEWLQDWTPEVVRAE